MTRRPPAFGALLALSLVVLSAVRADAATANSLTLRAVGTTGAAVTGSSHFAVGGDTAVSIAVVRLSGGTAKLVAGPDSASRAVQFPAYVNSGTYPRAVVRVTPTSGAGLSPGAANFQYGAVFRLDATSSGRSIDNGNNLFQRGLYGDAAQFKLQLDGGHPSCLVRGSTGRVFARSHVKVVANRWYRATCSRVGTRLTVQVSPFGSTAAPASTAASGSSGTLTFPSSRPASIGGKLSSSGAIVSGATDQFNGAVSQVWINRL